MTLPDTGVDPNWADIATVAILGAQLVILLLAAVVGYFQVREARRLREQQARPFVVVDIEAESFIFYVSVSNLGQTLARDVRISITPALTSTFDRHGLELASIQMFTDGIPSLPPGKKLRTILDSAIERKPENGYPDRYTATVEYWDDRRKKRFDATFELDLGIYWGLTKIERRDVHDVHEQLKKIGKTLESWSARGGGGLLRLSPAERRERDEESLARRQERLGAAASDATESGEEPAKS